MMFTGLIALLIVALDRSTKLWAVSHLKGKESLSVIENFFQLTYVENQGVAFGLFAQLNVLLPILSLGLILFLMAMARKYQNKGKRILLPLAFIIGGAIGNLIDRMTTKYVVDFLSFRFGNYDFPVFNVADIFVSLGAFFLLLFFLREEEREKG